MLTRYQPSTTQPWNVQSVVHLHRRAGFAANWAQIDRDLRDGPDAAIDRLIKPTMADEFEQLSKVICDAAVASENINRLKAWWLYRMLFTPSPLQERVALMWHNHFATSNLKLQNVGLMRNQNELFRRFGDGSFSKLLPKVIKDPAMLLWLDADANRKAHPNENLAREMMELFTLGVGGYQETDVKEAARALTGWTVHQREFRQEKTVHDDGEKTILEQRGTWDGDDLLRILVEHSSTPQRLAFRICEQWMGEGTASEQLIEAIAAHLRDHELNVGDAIETVLRSEAFFADENRKNRVMGPIEWSVGIARALEIFDPPPSTLLLAEWTTRLSQDLFNPPNVFGWPGGRAWLTSRTMIGRANFAAAIVEGRLHQPSHRFDAAALAEKYGFSIREQQQAFFTQLITGESTLPDGLQSIVDLNEFVVSLLTVPEAFIA